MSYNIAKKSKVKRPCNLKTQSTKWIEGLGLNKIKSLFVIKVPMVFDLDVQFSHFITITTTTTIRSAWELTINLISSAKTTNILVNMCQHPDLPNQ